MAAVIPPFPADYETTLHERFESIKKRPIPFKQHITQRRARLKGKRLDPKPTHLMRGFGPDESRMLFPDISKIRGFLGVTQANEILDIDSAGWFFTKYNEFSEPLQCVCIPVVVTVQSGNRHHRRLYPGYCFQDGTYIVDTTRSRGVYLLHPNAEVYEAETLRYAYAPVAKKADEMAEECAFALFVDAEMAQPTFQDEMTRLEAKEIRQRIRVSLNEMRYLKILIISSQNRRIRAESLKALLLEIQIFNNLFNDRKRIQEASK